MTAIEFDDLTKYYGDVRGVEDLAFAVREGEVFGFLGPNGAGKTTAIRSLMGFLRPTDGTARMLGTDVRDEADLIETRRDVGYLPAEPGFDEGVTGRAVLDYHASLKGDGRRAELLASFEPPLDRAIGEYSRGNRQKLAIVVAFMHDPDLLVMDEPTSGLDPLLQDRFHEFVRAERAAGKTAFFSSHTLGEVRKVCDRVGIVREGHLVALEDVETLLQRGGKRVRVDVAGDPDPGPFRIEGVHDLTVDGTVSFTYTGEYDRLVDLLDGVSIRDLEVREAPLEEVFIRFYGEHDPDQALDGGPDAGTVEANGDDRGPEPSGSQGGDRR